MPEMDYILPHPASWPEPKMTIKSEKKARPGYADVKSHEFLDSPKVLEQKVEVLCRMILHARKACVYSGAGISTASGINDYASKAPNSLSKRGRKAIASWWEAEPTISHRVLVELFKMGHVKHWCNQNHDGLPQKAGLPQYGKWESVC